MGKRKAGVGHNSGEPLTDEEQAALAQYYSLKIRAQLQKASQAKAIYDGERTEVNGLFAKVKSDLVYSRKEFEEILDLQDMTESEFIAHEGKRHKRLFIGGLPVSEQLELPLGDTVDDKIEAEANGYRAGRRADDPVPPDNIATFLHPEWVRGWHEGQEDNISQLAIAESVLTRREAETKTLSEADANAPDEPSEEEETF